MTARRSTGDGWPRSFTTRFDQEPARTHAGRVAPEWQPGDRQAYVLRVPAEAMPQVLNDARTAKALMFRHQFSGVPFDVHYDLTGFEKESSRSRWRRTAGSRCATRPRRPPSTRPPS